jgi:hypothetical protein
MALPALGLPKRRCISGGKAIVQGITGRIQLGEKLLQATFLP